MAYTEAGKRATIRYQKEEMKRIPLNVYKDEYAKIKAAADSAGEAVNEYIKNAIAQRMILDGLAPVGFRFGRGAVAGTVAGDSGGSGGAVPPVPHIQAAGGAGLPSQISESSEKA